MKRDWARGAQRPSSVLGCFRRRTGSHGSEGECKLNKVDNYNIWSSLARDCRAKRFVDGPTCSREE